MDNTSCCDVTPDILKTFLDNSGPEKASNVTSSPFGKIKMSRHIIYEIPEADYGSFYGFVDPRKENAEEEVGGSARTDKNKTGTI